jgi:thiamine transport system permease protein
VTGRTRLALLAVPALFLGCLFAWPVVAIVATSLRGPGGHGWDLGHAADTLVSPSTRHVLRFTVLQAVLSTAVTVAVALPAA